MMINTPTLMTAKHGDKIVVQIWNPLQIPRMGEMLIVDKRVYTVDTVSYSYSNEEVTILLHLSFIYMDG
jgi:hypothetical protein